jgi:uncharacterized coiled-coil protein SlyX
MLAEAERKISYLELNNKNLETKVTFQEKSIERLQEKVADLEEKAA